MTRQNRNRRDYQCRQTVGSGQTDNLQQPIITQEMIRHFQELRNLLCDAKSRSEQMRKMLISLLESHTPVEAGPLDVNFEFRPAPVFSVDALKALLGDDAVEDLRCQISAKDYCYVIVTAASEAQPASWTVAAQPSARARIKSDRAVSRKRPVLGSTADILR